MAFTINFAVLFIAIIAGKACADRASQYYGVRGSYDPLYESEDYETDPYQDSDENAALSLYQRYYNSPAVTSLYPFAYLRSYPYGYETEVEREDDDDVDEDAYAYNPFYARGTLGRRQTQPETVDDEKVVAAVDARGETYLLTPDVVRTLRANGLVSEDGSLLLPNGVLRVDGEEAVDTNSGIATYVLPKEQLHDVESDVLAVTDDDEPEAYGKTFGGGSGGGVRRRYGYRRRSPSSSLSSGLSPFLGIRLRYGHRYRGGRSGSRRGGHYGGQRQRYGGSGHRGHRRPHGYRQRYH